MDRERHPFASRRTMLRGLAAALPAATIAAVGATGHAQAATAIPADATTLDLIEGHRQALAACDAYLTGNDDEDADLAPEYVAMSDAETEALDRLIEREPTTLQGLRAFADYCDRQLDRNFDHENRAWALATIAEALRLLVPAPTV